MTARSIPIHVPDFPIHTFEKGVWIGTHAAVTWAA